MSIYRIILALYYTLSENWTLKRFLDIWKACQVSCSLSFIELALFFNDDDKVDSAFFMIKIIKTELSFAMGFWWLDDELHWARDIQKS
jgi:hypothetical protein